MDTIIHRSTKQEVLKEEMDAVLSLQPHIGDISKEENVVRVGGILCPPRVPVGRGRAS